LATTSTAAWPSDEAELGGADGLGSFGGEPFWSGGGGPKLHPASTPVTSASTANERPAALVAGVVTGPSLTVQRITLLGHHGLMIEEPPSDGADTHAERYRADIAAIVGKR
jgi:hypothetical protein